MPSLYSVPATLVVGYAESELRYPLVPVKVAAENSRRAVNAAFSKHAKGKLTTIVGNEDGTLVLHSRYGEIIEYRLTNITKEESRQ